MRPDNRPDNTGLDDGPYLPGRAPRKKPARKSPEEYRAIRAKAWATRRERMSGLDMNPSCPICECGEKCRNLCGDKTGG